jgi:hypothetical protein
MTHQQDAVFQVAQPIQVLMLSLILQHAFHAILKLDFSIIQVLVHAHVLKGIILMLQKHSNVILALLSIAISVTQLHPLYVLLAQQEQF